jgi:hypothetical protein
MSNTVSIQQAIEDFETLPLENQDLLLELIRKRRIEKRRTEIATNDHKLLRLWKAGRAKRGNLANLLEYE